jgi:ABC-type glycerol-3-phosphate transport system permease component
MTLPLMTATPSLGHVVCASAEIISHKAGYILTSIEWQPLSVAAEETLRGQFCAELSAFTSQAIIVPVIVGWLTQKQLVRGLTSGAVK